MEKKTNENIYFSKSRIAVIDDLYSGINVYIKK